MNPISKRKGVSPYIKSLPLLALCVPGLIMVIINNYLPMFGVIIAFKEYNYVDGILGSPFVGLKNFEFFFQSNDAAKIISNTLLYNCVNLLLKTVFCVTVALLLYEINSKNCIKYFQTTMALPSTISAVVVAYIGYALLSFDNGVVNTILENIGAEKILFYNEAKYWPFFIIFAQQWSQIGIGMLMYYGTLMNIDSQLFEAAEIDGARRIKQIIHIAIPALVPVISLTLILGVGHMLDSGLGLNYQLPMNSPAVYSTTDVIGTYLLRGIQTGSMGVSAAVGLFQNVSGMILLLVTNGIVRKISPDNAVF